MASDEGTASSKPPLMRWKREQEEKSLLRLARVYKVPSIEAMVVELGQMATCEHLGVSSPLMSSCLLKLLNPLISYESHIQYVVFSVVVTNQQPLSTVQRVNKIHGLTIVYGFYFTQCVCTAFIKRSTLSLSIYVLLIIR